MQSNITYQSKYLGTIRTRTHNSNKFGSCDISTATQTRKHPFIICKGKRGRRIEDQHQVTYRNFMYSLVGAIYPAYYRRIISAHNSENTFQNIVDLSFRCVTSIFFLVRVAQIKYLLRGFNPRHGHNVAREHLLLFEGIYTFTENLCSRLSNRRIISINSTYRIRHN